MGVGVVPALFIVQMPFKENSPSIQKLCSKNIRKSIVFARVFDLRYCIIWYIKTLIITQ